MFKLSWQDRKRGKRGMHLVQNRMQFSHVNLTAIATRVTHVHVKKGRLLGVRINASIFCLSLVKSVLEC